MYQIKCPVCETERSVKAKKKWMEGTPPFVNICKSCCQKGKEKSPETIAKLSESAKKLQTLELLEKKSRFMKDHPEYWENNLIAGSGAGWNRGLTVGPTPEEVKKNISEGMRKASKKRKKQ
jgi:hypothetical protein